MISFLGKVAQHIHENYASTTENLCVVLPSKRAGLFLKKEIANAFEKTIWSPIILAQDDFIQEICKAKIISSFELTLHFYSVYKNLPAEEEKDDFNEFLNWAPSLLSDFDSIDRHLIDPKKFFGYINESRALEVWNVDGQPLSDFQKNYLRFWKNLYQYYTALNTSLQEHQLITRGQAYRIASEIIAKNDFESKWTKVIFAGLNALTPAEEKIISSSLKAGWSEILFDSDEYYLFNKSQEAGTFLRKYLNSWNSSNFLWKEDLLQSDEKNIHIVACPQNIIQAKVAGEIIQTKFPLNSPNSAVILCDENLLLPFLNHLPEATTAVNITMGFPLKQTDLYPLIIQLFSLHDNALLKGKDYLFYHQDLLLLLAHEKMQILTSSEKFNELRQWITTNNKVYITLERCISFLGEDMRFILSAENKQGKGFLKNALQLALVLKENYGDSRPIESEYLFTFYTFLQKLSNLVLKYELEELNDLKSLKRVCIKLIKQEKLAFYGEPLRGLQIMGMLESRTLDFENIVLLSVNEGVIPKDKHQQSFIPFDIKKEFGLHTHQENDAIFAYHFYRILQRAKNIYLLYTSAGDGMGAQGEKSRFLKQIEMEYFGKKNPNVHLTSTQAALPSTSGNKTDIDIESSVNIIERLNTIAEKGFSPSAINKLIACPLDFYYRYVLGLGELDEVEEDIEASSMGTAIHSTLERMYNPFVGKILSATDVQKMLSLVESYLKESFEEVKISEIAQGKNHLTFNIAVDVVTQFLRNEITFIEERKSENKYLTIVSLEQKIEGELEIEVRGKTHKIKLKGIADRIDKVGDSIRLVDYKTGSVKDSELSFTMDDITSKNKGKALQLLWYSMLYLEQNPEVKMVTPGIISFRSLSKGIIGIKFNNSDTVNRTTCVEFKEQLKLVFENLFSGNVRYTHNSEAKYCQYC
ncbi:MAG: PD-(D/E)XK nuclease family protein [Bacteroidetes bacterium]|nr:PD-(D/E)XK nuclease family protein [Bacteroidota bacterium]